MIIRNVSIKSKLILAAAFILLLLFILSLIYLDSSRGLETRSDLLEVRSELNREYLVFQNRFHALSTTDPTGELSALIQSLHRTEQQIRAILSEDMLPQNEQINRRADAILSLLERIEERLLSSGLAGPELIARSGIDMGLLGTYMEEMNLALRDAGEQLRRQNNRQLGISMALAIFILAAVFILFTMHVQKAFARLSAYAQKLSKGDLPPPLESSAGDEFGDLAEKLNQHTRSLQKKMDWITSLSRDKPVEIFKPEAEDKLGNALLILSDYLTRKELQEITRNREDKKVNWVSEGLAQLGEVLRSEREHVGELSFLLIQKLVTYMNMEMGSFYVTNDTDPEKLSLELTATYAYDRRKFNSMNLEWGEGLPGTCAMEGEQIFLTDVPADYFNVSSALGHAKPNCILLVPLKLADRVVGVIELATVRLLRPFEIEFVESVSDRIASSLMAVRTNERTTQLLEQSQSQAKILQEQETVMRENLEKLEQAQQESRKKESEITGILNAIRQSTLVAELGLNGRYTSINERFLMLLESTREQVLGKLHSDFAMVDRTSEAYKSFWAALKEGKSISNEEAYRLYSGKEIYLQQTFTPIIDSEGRVQRILNIAHDITNERKLQEQIKSRELEITRTGLDMQTLNMAVNNALLKCELDAEGIILMVNDKYCEVTGYSRKELMGRNYRLFLKDMEKEQFEKIWNEVLKEKVYEGSIRRSLPTGEEVWLVSTFSPVIDEKGVIYKVYFLGLDITENRLKYQLLEDANQEIERLRKRLTEFE